MNGSARQFSAKEESGGLDNFDVHASSGTIDFELAVPNSADF